MLFAAIKGFGANAPPVLTRGTGRMNPAAAMTLDGTGLMELERGVGEMTFIGAIGIGRAGVGAGVAGLTACGVGAGGRTTGSGVVIGAGGFTASAIFSGAGSGASDLSVFNSGFGCGLVTAFCCSAERDELAAEGDVSPCLVRTGNSLR